MNTTPAKRPTKRKPRKEDAAEVDFFDLEPGADASGGASKLAENIAELQIELAAEKDNRNEERLYWLFGGFLPVNVLIYVTLEAWFPFLLLFVFQLVVMLALARKFGHEWAAQAIGWFLNWIVSRFSGTRGNPSDDGSP